MSRRRTIPTLLLVLAAAAPPLGADAAPAGHEDSHFTVADFERFGVRFASAGPGMVDTGVELPGEVRPNAERTAHVAAQFAGRVREVRVRVGDAVRAGQTLAIVESDTLAPYPLTTAFDGTVIDQHVTPGETVGPGAPAFVVADLATVWVEINVYQKDLAAVRIGERVRVLGGHGVGEADGAVSFISPVLDQATRTAIARVVLANATGLWRPGLFVTAHVLDPQPAAVVVPRSAVQRMGGAPVVFVVDGDRVEPRPVRLGRSGRQRVEIVDGLAAGTRYAEDGTFLLKAELEADESGHDDH
ncbi:efflux RND transporter periplasmic adaptor subunit [bacterium]|nr:efflux RND transporter periplasmic adaptor subunit [bacterium]